jgi:hypothetical protein
VLLSELSTAFFCGGINSKPQILILVRVGERVEQVVSFLLTVLVLKHMSTMSPPGR